MKKIYLVGPINGKTYEDAISWRKDAERELVARYPDCRVLNPLTGLEHLRGTGLLGEDGHDERRIFLNSYAHTVLSDVVLVNLLGATKISLGSVSELAWAHDHAKGIVIVCEPEGNPHDGMFLRQYMYRDDTCRVDNLEAGIDAVIKILNGERVG